MSEGLQLAQHEPASEQALPPPPAPRPRPRLEVVSVAEPPFSRTPEFLVRVGLLRVLGLVAFAVLGLQLWSLQVLKHERYALTARAQSHRVLEWPAPRGPIVDARGRLLAGTEERLAIMADPAALGRFEPSGRWVPSPRGVRVLERLAPALGISTPRLEAAIRRSLAELPYAPVQLVPAATRRLAFLLEEQARAFRGIRVVAIPRRSYPRGAPAEEVLGLVGEVTAEQLRDPRFRGYRPRQQAGRSGVELTYDRPLNGGFERLQVPVDALGRPVGPARELGPEWAPFGLRLTLDLRLQRAAERALRRGIELARSAGHADAGAGAAVVMSPSTGAIYALASVPGFDQAAAAASPRYLARLLSGREPGRPLLNRATQGVFPPGSTFKPVVVVAALASGLLSPSSALPCTGSLRVGNQVFRNVDPWANATLTIPQALAISCDTWFYRVGLRLYERQRAGDPLLQRWALRLGLGRRTGLDLPGEERGLVPLPGRAGEATAPWRRAWYPGDSVNLSIGQGYLLVTPLQLAVAYAALANGGIVVRPHVGEALVAPSGRVVKRLRFPPRARLRLPGLDLVREGLVRAAREGTSASVFGDFPVPVAGKTGTAEAPPGSDHSWYASWAPAARPRVVVVVLIEHGGFGSQAAAPAARDIYRAFFRLEGRR